MVTNKSSPKISTPPQNSNEPGTVLYIGVLNPLDPNTIPNHPTYPDGNVYQFDEHVSLIVAGPEVKSAQGSVDTTQHLSAGGYAFLIRPGFVVASIERDKEGDYVVRLRRIK